MNAPLVCGAGPPGNANAGLGNRRREKLIDVQGGYHRSAFVESEIVWNRWCREAQRLFTQYWRTGDVKHLFAFTTHLRAMRTYGGPRK
jgi:hypothetical protein